MIRPRLEMQRLVGKFALLFAWIYVLLLIGVAVQGAEQPGRDEVVEVDPSRCPIWTHFPTGRQRWKQIKVRVECVRGYRRQAGPPRGPTGTTVVAPACQNCIHVDTPPTPRCSRWLPPPGRGVVR